MQKAKLIKYAVPTAISAMAIAAGLFGLPPLSNAQAQNLHRVVAVRRHEPPTVNKKDFEISPLETRVLGQRAWLRGGPASLRVIVSNHITGKSVPASVALSLVRLENGKAEGATDAALHRARQTVSAPWTHSSTRPRPNPARTSSR